MIEPLATCPTCGTAGHAVSPVTVRSLARPETLATLGEPSGFHYCPSRTCPVVWFRPADGMVLTKDQLRVRVGMKETAPPRPICYCFGHTVEEMADQVAATGTTDVPQRIAERCRRGEEHCEDSNPQGRCCLGNVKAVVRELMTARGDGAPAGHDPAEATGACCLPAPPREGAGDGA